MVAFVEMAPDCAAILAAHVPLKLLDRRSVRPPHDVRRNGLMRFAALAADFKIEIPGIARIPERRRWLSRPLEGEHALVPGFAGEPIGFLARLRRPLSAPTCRRAYRAIWCPSPTMRASIG